MKLVYLTLFLFALTLSACSSQLTSNDHLLRANDFLQNKEFNSAIIEYKNAIKLEPENPQFRLLLGKAYIEIYNNNAAIKEFNKAVDLGFASNKVAVFSAKAYAQASNQDEIIEKAVLVNGLSDQDTATILAIRATAYQRKSDKDNALKLLKEASKVDADNTELSLAWARYESQYGTLAKQMKWLQPLLDREVADAWSQMGAIDNEKKDLDKAEAAYTRAISYRAFVHQDYLSRALVRVGLKKYDEALADIDILKKARFNSPLVSYAEGVIAFGRKDYDLAQNKLDDVVAVTVKFPPALFVLGLVHYEKQNYENAVNYLSRYLDLNSTNTQARFTYAISLQQLGKTEQAIGVLEVLNKENPSDTRIASVLGGAYVKTGELDKAIALFDAAVKSNPTVAKAQLQLGAALLSDAKTAKQGQQALIKALDIDPELTQANTALYLSYMQTKLFDEAAKIAQKMIDKSPDDSLAYNLLAQTYLVKKDEAKATELFESALKRFPSDPLTSRNVARLKIKDKKVEEAKAIFINVLKKNPNDLGTLTSLAGIEATLGNDDKKINYLKKAVKLNPDVLSPKLILAFEYVKEAEYQEALSLLRDVEDGDKPEVQLLAIKAQMGLKKYDYSLSLLKKLVVKYPEMSSAYFLKGQLHALQNKGAKAKSAFEKVISLVPEHFASQLMLARISLLNNDKVALEKSMDILMKLKPKDTEVRWLNSKLVSSDKDYEAAIATLEELIKDAPTVGITIDLARNKWISGDKDGALLGLELWQNNNEDDAKVLMLMSQFYLNQNRLDDANLIHTRLDKIVPNNPIILNNMAWSYRFSDLDLGIKYAEKALSLAPKNAFVKDTLAMLLLSKGNTVDALLYSTQAMKDVPDFIEIQVNHAEILIASNQKAKAKKLLQGLTAKSKLAADKKRIKELMTTL